MSGIWAHGQADPSIIPQLTNFANADQAGAARQAFNQQTYAPAANYLGGILNNTQPTAAEQAGVKQQGLLNAANSAMAGSTRGGIGAGNAAKNAGTASASSGIPAQIAQGRAAERAGAAQGLGGLGYTAGTNALQGQNLQQQQAIDPALTQLGMRSQDMQQSQLAQQNTSDVMSGIGSMAAGGSIASDMNLKSDIDSKESTGLARTMRWDPVAKTWKKR